METCLLTRKSDKGIAIMVLHVDDCFTVGYKEVINEVDQLKKVNGLEWKVDYNFQDYLGCKIQINKDRQQAWISQPHMIRKLQQFFGQLIFERSKNSNNFLVN